MEEQLSGACTVEIAAFDEFTKLLGDAQATDGFDHIIFDTAPHGAHASLVEAPGRMDRIHCRKHDGHLVPWAMAGLETQEIPLRFQPAGAHGRVDDNAGSRKPAERSALAEANRSRAELAEMVSPISGCF